MLLFGWFASIQSALLAQESPAVTCRTSEETENYFQLHPEARQEAGRALKQMSEMLSSSRMDQFSATTYTIPVVFHVFGTDFAGYSVTEQIIQTALEKVNEDYQGLNDDYDDVLPLFAPIRQPMSISFKLAKIDPNGNPTTGITFNPVRAGFGNGGGYDNQIQQFAWDNYKYMNVYIMLDLYADGDYYNSGVAWYPNTYMSDNNLARVVYNGRYLYGNTNKEFASVLTHEFGHWLDLRHTFEGGCVTPGSSSNGDLIADTPPTTANTGTCNTTVEKCAGAGIPNGENYMDYSSCYRMFTQGQVARMIAALNLPSRHPLWQPANLAATGVNENMGAHLLFSNNNLLEADPNDGSVAGQVSIEAKGGITFAQTGILTQGVHFTAQNVPAGLTMQVLVNTSTEAQISFSGNASSHLPSNNIADVGITFLDAAIDGGVGNVLNPSYSDISLTFFAPYQIVYNDVSDLTVNSGNTWEFFRIVSGNAGNYGLWIHEGNLRFETYKKDMVCEGGTRNISVLEYGTMIEDGSNWIAGGDYPDEHYVRTGSYTAWDGRTAYMGFRFTTDSGKLLSGWFRISVNSTGTAYTLLDYAYNETPNGSIQAGFTTLPAIDPPVVDFNITPATAQEGETVQLTDASSNSPTAWSWVFQDGTPATSSQQNPTVIFSSAGTKQVTLTASNAAGNGTAVSKQIIITANTLPPEADFTASATAIIEGESVSFTDQSTNNPASWSWSFEGGTPETSTLQHPTVAYDTPGTYEVSLTVSNANGTDTLTRHDYITVEAQTGGGVTPTYCPATVQLDYNPIERVQLGSIDNSSGWGSNGYQDFRNLSANLNKGQAYTVTVTNKSNHWSDIDVQIWIDWDRNGAFDAGERVYHKRGAGPFAGTFTVPAASGTGNTGMRIRTAYGDTPSACGYDDYQGEVEDYTVRLLGSGAAVAPVADFSADGTNALEGATIQFSDESTNDPTAWSWTFEGGTPGTSTAQNPAVVYANAGTYQVSLTASNSAGSDTETKTGYITIEQDSTGGTLPAYCDASVSSNYNPVVRVEMGGIDNSSGWGANGYQNFQNLSTNILKGQTYTVSITHTHNHWSDIDAQVWIDWDRDGEFEASERVYHKRGSGTFSGSFAVPQSASIGLAGMRVRTAYGNTPAPCGHDDYQGEVEDYAVNIVGSGNAASRVSPLFRDEKKSLKKSLDVFPNPSEAALHIQADGFSKNARIEIFDGQGKRMVIQNYSETIDLSAFSKGSYWLIISENGKKSIARFFKK
ncbi:MAG: PKD domain-containing protein [Cytophagales bacterium]|nr:PKD domain-containing protein [Cytophagales bacterium]